MNTTNVVNNDVTSVLTKRIYSKFDQSNINPTITEITEISLTNLKSNYNKVRTKGECLDTVTKMCELIKNGEYDPFRYVPPIVESVGQDKYMIVSGHHRFMAHRALDINTMLCVIVKFNDERERSIWRQLENTNGFDGFVKNVSTDEENIAYVSDLVNKNIIAADRKSIQDYILDARLVSKKAEKSINKIVNSVLKNTDNHHTYDYVKSWSDTEKKEVVEVLQNKFPNKKFISAAYKELEDCDYDHRTVVRICDSFLEDPTRPIVIVYAVNGADKQKIESIREFKPNHLVSSFVNRWTKVLELQSKGYDLNKLVTLDHLPQFGSEIKGTNDGIDDFIANFEKKYSNNDEVTEKLMEAMLTATGNDRKALKDRIKKILNGDREPQEITQ
jgi:hypothetical protein